MIGHITYFRTGIIYNKEIEHMLLNVRIEYPYISITDKFGK